MFCATVYAQQKQRETFDVGVLALRGHDHARQAWEPTVDWLSSESSEYKFQLHTYDFDQLETAFLNNQLDFILTSPGQATKLAREFPISWLATQKTAYSDIPNKSIASVVIVREDSKYKKLSQVDEARIGAVSEKAFGGFLALRYEVDKLGFFSSSFFKNIEFTGPPTDQIILDVINHDRDVAIVPACTLESLVAEGRVNLKDVRVLNEQRPANSICAVSTPLYPNWTLAMTERTPIEVGQYVAQTLFAMPSDHPAASAANNKGWMLAVPSVDVDNVYKHLDLHPLQKDFSESATGWLVKHRSVVIVILLSFLVLTLYHISLAWRFKHNQRKLSSTLNDLRTKSSLLEYAQRVTIVGELGSSLAHEINQPLAAIKNYSQGAKNRLEQGVTPEELEPVLNRIQQQVGVASDIIQRLRALIKKKPVEKRWVDLRGLISESIKLVEYEFERKGVRLQVAFTGVERLVYVDPTGFLQVMLNLLTNAKDACQSHDNPSFPLLVTIDIVFGDDQLSIDVIDNGIGFDESKIPLEQVFYTTKAEGLGLGLAICRDIIEAHSGTIRFLHVEPTGCQVSIQLPYLEENDAS
ncbi:ABC transporter [Vibrio sp. B1FLJ16]|nr:ABC transporter [Vibrio sp. B1FLJ16]CAE6896157.1 ABC transporter [Vibrio sp. B1FLJ16]